MTNFICPKCKASMETIPVGCPELNYDCPMRPDSPKSIDIHPLMIVGALLLLIAIGTIVIRVFSAVTGIPI